MTGAPGLAFPIGNILSAPRHKQEMDNPLHNECHMINYVAMQKHCEICSLEAAPAPDCVLSLCSMRCPLYCDNIWSYGQGG